MGTPVKDIIIGANCGHWDPPDETPIVLYCLFWDIAKGSDPNAKVAPNGHLFKVPQRELSPCDWKYSNVPFGWEVSFNLQANQMTLELRESAIANRVYFLKTKPYPPLDEYEVFSNDDVWPPGVWGAGGYGIIFWMLDIIAIAHDLCIDHVDDLMLEVLPVSTTELVIKFCSLTLHMNVKLKISI